MREFAVKENDEGKKLVRVILQKYPRLPAGAVFKALRQKDVLVNDKRVRQDIILRTGDQIRVFLPADLPEKPLEPTPAPYSVVFSDKSYLLLNKSPGIMVQPGRTREESPAGSSLIEIVRTDFQQAEISLCHRLDSLTGGLIILARNPGAWQRMQVCLRQEEVIKRYQCLVLGIPQVGEPLAAHDGKEFFRLQSWLQKDAARKKVYMHEYRQPGDKKVITLYRIIRTFPDAGPSGEPVSHLEVELRTGRTHQIRAHLASAGHPLLGDGKYGSNNINRHFFGARGRLKRQQLCATSLTFRCAPDILESEIGGRSFSVPPDFDWLDFTRT